MSTPSQIEANRRNAQHSTGPRTTDGKVKTRQNALRHGLCAGIPLMSDEQDEEVQTLLDALREEHQPVGATEEILVYKMAEHFFSGKRAAYLLSEQLDWADKGEENTRQIGLMLRYHTTADRAYHKAFNELRKLQKERRDADAQERRDADAQERRDGDLRQPRAAEIGSVSQNAEAPPINPPKPELVTAKTAASAAPIAGRTAPEAVELAEIAA